MAPRTSRAARKAPSRSTKRASARRRSKRNDVGPAGLAHAVQAASDRRIHAHLRYGEANEFSGLPHYDVHLQREHGRWGLAKGPESLRLIYEHVPKREADTVVAAVQALLAGKSITVAPRLALMWATSRGVSRGIRFASLGDLAAFADEAIVANKLNRHPRSKGNRSFWLPVGARVAVPGHGTGVIVRHDTPAAWTESVVFGGRTPSKAEVARLLAKNTPARLGIHGKSPVRWPSGRITWVDDRSLAKQNTMVIGREGPYDIAEQTLAVDPSMFRRVTLSTAESWAAPHMRGRARNSPRQYEEVAMTTSMQETLRSRAKTIGQHKRGRVYVQEPGATRGGDRWALVRKV